jgi:hypothetical protein
MSPRYDFKVTEHCWGLPEMLMENGLRVRIIGRQQALCTGMHATRGLRFMLKNLLKRRLEYIPNSWLCEVDGSTASTFKVLSDLVSETAGSDSFPLTTGGLPADQPYFAPKGPWRASTRWARSWPRVGCNSRSKMASWPGLERLPTGRNVSCRGTWRVSRPSLTPPEKITRCRGNCADNALAESMSWSTTPVSCATRVSPR